MQVQFAAGQVNALCNQAIEKTEGRLNSIVSLDKDQQTFENTVLAYEAALADLNDWTLPLTFTGYTSTDQQVSEEGSACEQKIGEVYVDFTTRRELYNVLSLQKPNDPMQARLLQQHLLSFEQNGMKLSDAALARVKELKTQLALKESQFSAQLNADSSSLTFSVDDMKGAPSDFLERLKRTPEGLFIVTTKSTDYTDLMQNVSIPETRQKMMLAYLNRGGEKNTLLLQEAIDLRRNIAKKLGFAHWADLRTSGRMAKSSSQVLPFLNNLKEKLTLRNQQDLDQLLQFKKELDPSATTLDPWDNSYLSTQLQKRDFNLDNEKIREYFPTQNVVSGIFSIYSQLLGVQFVEVQDAVVWADGVKLYEIHDGKDCHLMGYFFTDFIPRPLKYGHAAAFPLIGGRSLGAGNYSLPIASIVANFTPPVGQKPSLLTHDEVETFFHEFGHIMHQTLTRAPYASLSGSATAQDFVEAPSQMLENWVWNASVLNKISGHYLNTAEKLPPELLKQMLAAKNFQQGSRYTKQLLYALFDMTIHTQEGPVDVTQTYDNLFREIIHQEPVPGNHFAASFGHLMGGYDAGYYGYLWSEVYAQDMFSQFPEGDLTNAEVGGRYRRAILEQGNMKDALDLLKEFLGREPNSDAFFKMLGL